MRRFAKSVKGSNPSAGSNPVLSAWLRTALPKAFTDNALRRAVFVDTVDCDKTVTNAMAEHAISCSGKACLRHCNNYRCDHRILNRTVSNPGTQ
jgi:hypothetical protein